MSTAGADLFIWWARIAWIAAYLWIAASHTTHVWYMRGQARAWHMCHLLMAAGMVYMFTPWTTDPMPLRGWEKAYWAASIAIAAFVVAQWARNRAVNLLWFSQLMAMVAMAYMFALMRGATPPTQHLITWALAAFYVLEAAAWSRRHYAEADQRRASWIPFSLHPRPGSAVGASRLCGRIPVDLAVSGTVMSLGMAYMFLAMDTSAAAWISRATAVGHEAQSLTGAVLLFAAVLLVVPVPLLPPRRRHHP
jgi:hypothetical protein